MIHPVSGKSDVPYSFKAFSKLPVWKRASKTALLALETLGTGSHSCTKEGRQITVSFPHGGREAVVKVKNAPSAPKPRVPFELAIVDPFPLYAEKDVGRITELLTMLDNAHVLGLTLIMWRLADIGDEIAHLHPFTFLKIVLNDPDLRPRLYRIVHSLPKRLGLMNGNGIREGFNHQFNRESKNNSLEPCINDFAASLHLPPDEIRKLVLERRWTDLFYYLTQKTLQQENRSFRA